MATNFPTSLDTLTNPTSSDSLSSPSHSSQHANVNDAVEALQAKVGADSSAVTSSLDYKVAQLEGRDTAGLVPLSTQDFTSVSAVNIDNVFTADYRAYKIVFRQTALTSNASMQIRLRSGGTTNSANYQTERLFGYGSSVAASQDPTGTDDWYLGNLNTTYPDRYMCEMTLFDPYSTNTTVAIAHASMREPSTQTVMVFALHHNDTSLMDGMSLFPSAGNFSGTISIYGMVEA